MEKSEGAQIRSRAQYVEKGEKSSAYYLNLEKQRQILNTLTHLV
jgi:hypothetical protein